jgi:hypothetical protein
LIVRETSTLWGINRLVYDIARTNRVGKRSPAGDVIGVNVGVDDVRDAHARLATHLLVRADVFDRIDDDALALAAAAEEVRRADGDVWRNWRKIMSSLLPDVANLAVRVRFVQ